MTAVHQLVHTLSYGDAISTEVLALQRALRDAGVESEIFAIHEHPKLKGATRHFSTVSEVDRAGLVLHYSIGSPLNEVYSSWTRGRRTLIYHNITPPHWFRGINQRVANDIERGVSELPQLCSLTDILVADSPFNASELATLGFNAEVLDLPVDPGRWNRPRNEGIYNLVKGTPGIHVLHVGRLAPNKCVEDVIKAFCFLNRYIEKQSRLWLVGIDTDTELYSFSLKRLVAGLVLEQHVEFVGCLADEEVRALYESCSVYLCASEHEGFCLPIIEAMHFGLPVIAYAAGAVPDTVGDGGILYSQKRPAELAELIAEVHTNQPLREQLVGAGKARVQTFSFERFARRVAEIFVREPSASKVAAS